MEKFFTALDPFLRDLGAELTHCEPGKATVELELQERHMSYVGRPHAHAGVLFSLAECASYAAFLSYGHNAFAVEGNISFMGAVAQGKVIATAKCKDAYGEESGKIRVTVATEEEQIIARATFISYYTGEDFVAE